MWIGPFRTTPAPIERTMQLSPWARLPVLVVDAEGHPLAGVQLSAVDPAGHMPSTWLRPAQTDADGRATLLVPPGALRIDARFGAKESMHCDVDAQAGDNEPLRLQLP
jgi:hypothetical protein